MGETYRGLSSKFGAAELGLFEFLLLIGRVVVQVGICLRWCHPRVTLLFEILHRSLSAAFNHAALRRRDNHAVVLTPVGSF